MTKTLQAVFDGQVLRPEEPLDLKPNTPVRITIDTGTGKKSQEQSFLQAARDLRLEGPADWSSRIEEYLYGRELDGSR
jgi:hypothetical protein